MKSIMQIQKIRINVYGDGKHYVEVQTRKKTFFRKEKWECISFYSGTDIPYGYATFDGALSQFVKELRRYVIENSA